MPLPPSGGFLNSTDGQQIETFMRRAVYGCVYMTTLTQLNRTRQKTRWYTF